MSLDRRSNTNVLNLTERQRQSFLWLGVALAMIVVLVALRPVLTPFIAAMILGYVLMPGVNALVKFRLPRALAVAIVILLSVAAFSALLLLIVPILQKELAQIRLQLPSIMTQITDELLPRLRQLSGMELKFDSNSVKDWLTKNMSGGGTDIAATAFDYIRSGGSAALEVLGLVFLVPVVLFYVLLDWPRLKPRLVALVPRRWLNKSGDWSQEVDGMLAQYLRGQFKVMFFLALYYAVALAIARFDLWLPIGVLSGMLVFIPYAGFAIGLLFALGAGILQFGWAKGLIAVAIVYGIGQLLESIVLTPKLVGEQIGLHPLAVILALLAFGYLLGFVGVLLALPLAATLAVAMRHLKASYLESSFYKSVK